MKLPPKAIPAAALGLVNGYFLGVGREQWTHGNDVARQWVWIVIPCMMIIASLVVITITFIAGRVWGKSPHLQK